MKKQVKSHQVKVIFGSHAQTFSWLSSAYIVKATESDEHRAVRRAVFRSLLVTTLAKISLYPCDRPKMFRSLMDFVIGRRSIEGLETIFLSLMVDAAHQSNTDQVHEAFAIWERFARVTHFAGAGPMGYFDARENKLFLLSRAHAASLRPGGANIERLRPGSILRSDLASLGTWSITTPFLDGAHAKPIVLHILDEKTPAQRARKTTEAVAGTVVLIGTIVALFPGGQAVGAGLIIGGLAAEATVRFWDIIDDEPTDSPGTTPGRQQPPVGYPPIIIPTPDIVEQPGAPICTGDGSEDGGDFPVGVYGGPEADGGDTGAYGDGEGGGDGGGCFSGGIEILMADGSRKSIADVRTGDQVLASDRSGSLSGRIVEHKHEAEVDALVRLRLDTGNMIEATGGHRFWVESLGFVPARELHAGMRLRPAGAGPGPIVEHVNDVRGQVGVFNLTVGQDHTFFVGQDGVLVHNRKISGPIEV